MSQLLFTITSPTFCAGILVNDRGSVVECAPILRRMFSNQKFGYVESVCKARGWTLTDGSGRPPITMLGVPITHDDAERISKDGP